MIQQLQLLLAVCGSSQLLWYTSGHDLSVPSFLVCYQEHVSKQVAHTWKLCAVLMANVVLVAGKLIGQAVAIHEWEFEDGTRGGPIADADAAAVASRKQSTQPPADEADINQAGSCLAVT